MPTIPNRSEDLTSAGERKRKSRGTDSVSKGDSQPLIEFEQNPEWHPSARMLWEAGLNSGGSSFYENSDLAVLHFTCDAVDHWLRQGGRRSPELLRVIFQSFASLLFTEGDRRKVRIELEKVGGDDAAFDAALIQLFEDEGPT